MLDKYIVIGGSAGSFPVITQILCELPKDFPYTIFMCLHRLKHVRNGFIEALSIRSQLPIVEPDDKQIIEKNTVYLAPANYHMYVENSEMISLSAENVVNHSRPSIDLTFISAARTFKSSAIAILLSGANKDGALGMKAIKDFGGKTIIQDPEECQVKTMTTAAQKVTQIDYTLTTPEIIDYLKKLAY